MHTVFRRRRALPLTSFDSVVHVHFCPAYLATPAIWVLCAEEHGALETLMKTRNLRALSIGWLLPMAYGRPESLKPLPQRDKPFIFRYPSCSPVLRRLFGPFL